MASQSDSSQSGESQPRGFVSGRISRGKVVAYGGKIKKGKR